MKTLLPICLLATGILAVAEFSSKGDWPRWRGPSDLGSSHSGKYVSEWSDSNHLAWKLALPGKGCSTPIVMCKQIILTSPLGGDDAVLGLTYDHFSCAGRKSTLVEGREAPLLCDRELD